MQGACPVPTRDGRGRDEDFSSPTGSPEAVARPRLPQAKRVPRWSQPGHGDARPDRYLTTPYTAQSSPKAIVIAAQANPRPTSTRHHLTAALSRLASTINTAIKSP